MTHKWDFPFIKSRGENATFSPKIREFLKNLLWLRSSFGNRNPEQVAMVAIETWLFAMVVIRIATLIATLIETLVETSVSESFRGFESKSQP